jgi:hypothetical protein
MDDYAEFDGLGSPQGLGVDQRALGSETHPPIEGWRLTPAPQRDRNLPQTGSVRNDSSASAKVTLMT